MEKIIVTIPGLLYKKQAPFAFRMCGWDLAKWLERLTVNALVATVLGSIPASVGTVESEERQMKQCWTKKKNPPQKNLVLALAKEPFHCSIGGGGCATCGNE